MHRSCERSRDHHVALARAEAMQTRSYELVHSLAQVEPRRHTPFWRWSSATNPSCAPARRPTHEQRLLALLGSHRAPKPRNCWSNLTHTSCGILITPSSFVLSRTARERSPSRAARGGPAPRNRVRVSDAAGGERACPARSEHYRAAHPEGQHHLPRRHPPWQDPVDAPSASTAGRAAPAGSPPGCPYCEEQRYKIAGSADP
jgi:hypothetical protein